MGHQSPVTDGRNGIVCGVLYCDDSKISAKRAGTKKLTPKRFKVLELQNFTLLAWRKVLGEKLAWSDHRLRPSK